jgi:hypothetical protein
MDSEEVQEYINQLPGTKGLEPKIRHPQSNWTRTARRRKTEAEGNS